MSLNYSESLKPYENKGEVGMDEIHDTSEVLESKIETLYQLIKNASFIVVYCGAGISTSSGIPDFRGPNGVWTLEKKGKKSCSISFLEAKPSYTHIALKKLYENGIIKFVVSQNVDGLFHRSGFPEIGLAELHGNVFVEKCDQCGRKYYRPYVIGSVGLKPTGKRCEGTLAKKPCRGKLVDFTLDWDNELPEPDFTIAKKYGRRADLSIALGTSLQIEPVGSLPLLPRRKSINGNFVTVNLQPTKYEKKASLAIHAEVDKVMKILMEKLNILVNNEYC
ncbi:NAD-dependent protein deacetylase sirtuin-6 [Strongyloides ratti]|uniref:protein acetyllysine N-acetyltransferase n=1 Tax=Strongyloides ratti TaxID=34506 RepID=A0A090LHW8_STRRB|nr:NAD-dependent protein deacetylase sirtuin-6 [Strongyloides ratti]CEF69337.1 NAD-dependent protein deacetylase sirtuin-6 [Strongyloides ratti]